MVSAGELLVLQQMSGSKRKNDFKIVQDKAREWHRQQEAAKAEQAKKKLKNSGNESHVDSQDPMGSQGNKKWDAPTLAQFFEAAGQAIKFDAESIDERRKRAAAILKEVNSVGKGGDDDKEDTNGDEWMREAGKGSKDKTRQNDSEDDSDGDNRGSLLGSESDEASEVGENAVARVEQQGVQLRSGLKSTPISGTDKKGKDGNESEGSMG